MVDTSMGPLLLSFPIGSYSDPGWAPLAADAEVDRVLEILSPFILEHEPWTDVEPDGRDIDALYARLRSWQNRRDGRGTILYWAGHGWLDNQTPGLALHSTPVGQSYGLLPQQLGIVLSDRDANTESASWTFVVVDSCQSAHFVKELAGCFLKSANGRLLLLGVSGDGETRLGEFSSNLGYILRTAYASNDEIPLAGLAKSLKDAMPGSVYLDLDMPPATLVRRRPASSVNAALDLAAEVDKILGKLSEVDREHFVRKSQGADAGELAWHFKGRKEQQRQIADWLRRRDRGIIVVTGDPGVGKSALLGQLLAQSRPGLREVLVGHELLVAAELDERPPDGSFTATLLLANVSAVEMLTLIARSNGLSPPVAIDRPIPLADWMAPRLPACTLMLDALEEAENPLEVALVLRRLADVPGFRAVVGMRRDGELLKYIDSDEPPVEVPHDGVAIGEYIFSRLTDAARRGILTTADPDQMLRASIKVGISRHEFLFAHLAVHEILARPGLLDVPSELDQLLAFDPGELFETAVERLGGPYPFVPPLLRALVFARRGLPISGGIWATVAQAVFGGTAATPAEFDTLLQVAAPYLIRGFDNGETVYRLAHRAFHDVLVGQVGSNLAEGHLRILRALLNLADGPALHPYLGRFLSGHAADAGTRGWRALAARPDVLDRIEARALWRDSVQSGFSNPDLPAEIVGVIGAGHLLKNASPADRRGLRQVAMARYAATSRFAESTADRDAAWSVHTAWLRQDEPHAVLKRSSGRLNAIASFVNRNGDARLATAGDDDVVRIWDPASGEQLRQIRTHHGIVWDLVTVPGANGRPLLASSGTDGKIRLLDPADGQPRHRAFKGHRGPVRALVTFVHNGENVLVSGGEDGTLRLWDLGSGEQLGEPLTGHRNWVMGVTVFVGTDGRTLLASASRDRTVQIWDPIRREELRKLTGHTDWVLAVRAFRGKGIRDLLATASSDRTVRIWDPDTAQEVRAPFEGHTRWVRDLAVLPGLVDRTLLASVGDDEMLRIWDPLTGQEIRRPWAGHTKGVHAVVPFDASDGRVLLATAGHDRTVRIWDPMAPPPPHGWSVRHHGAAVNGVTAYHNRAGQPWLATASADRTVRLWELRAHDQSGDRLLGHKRGVTAVAALGRSDRSTLVATASRDGSVRIWDPTTGRQQGQPLLGHRGPVTALVTFNGPGKRSLVASAGRDRTIRVWDAVAGTTFGDAMVGHTGYIKAMTTLRGPNGEIRLATGGDDSTIRIWDPIARAEVRAPIPSRRRSVQSMSSFVLEGQNLLAIGRRNGEISVIDPVIGIQRSSAMRGHSSGVAAISVLKTPDGRTFLVSGGNDRKLRIWDVADGMVVAVVPIGVAVRGLCVVAKLVAVACVEGILTVDLSRIVDLAN